MSGRETFPRRERLTKTREYQSVYANGTRTVGPAFICYVVRQEGKGRKFGLAVSRKVGGAVTRNRVKRYIREIYRAFRKQMVDDVCLVVVARPTAANLNFAQCKDAISRLFRNGDVLSE